MEGLPLSREPDGVRVVVAMSLPGIDDRLRRRLLWSRTAPGPDNTPLSSPSPGRVGCPALPLRTSIPDQSNLKNLLLIAALLLVSAFTLQQEQAPPPAKQVTVIALRHGEKAQDDPRDPHLSEAGQERALDLARLLSHAGVTHLYTTPYRRTRETLEPLAKATGISVTEYSPRDLKALAEQLSALPPASVAVISGHSNTTPALVLALGGDIVGLETVRGGPALLESEYDRLFVTTLPGNKLPVHTLELRYGE